MKRTLLAVGLALSFGLSSGVTATAKTPPEVLKPYKAYRAALKAEQKEEAAKFAYEAWQTAEEFMGADKTTGDLAVNFAALAPKYMDDRVAWEKVMKAHKRGIDLSNLSGADAAEIEIDRRIKYLAWVIPNVSTKISSARSKKYDVDQLKAKVEEFGLKGTTFEAEAYALAAQRAMISKDWKDAVTQSTQAITCFDARTDNLFSLYEYAVPIYLARGYSEQDMLIDAALTYQELMDKLETSGGHKNVISSDAFGEWLRLRDEVAKLDTSDPRTQQVTSYTVPTGREKELSPLLRKPPVFPARFLRGSKSGFVRVKFNVDIEGHVVDPIITSSTNKGLHDATLEALEGWRYTPNLPEARSRDIETTIRFDLRGRGGKRFEDGEEKSRL